MSFPLVHTSFDNSNLIDFSINKKLISAAGEYTTGYGGDNPAASWVLAGRTEQERKGERNPTHLWLVCLRINKKPGQNV